MKSKMLIKITCAGGESSCALRQVEIPIVSKDECNIYYENTIRSSQICAGLKEGGKDSCQVIFNHISIFHHLMDFKG